MQKGSLDLRGALRVGADGNLKLTDGVASISDLALAFPGNRSRCGAFPTLAAAASTSTSRRAR